MPGREEKASNVEGQTVDTSIREAAPVIRLNEGSIKKQSNTPKFMIHHGSFFIINSIVVGKDSVNIRFLANQSNKSFFLTRAPGPWMAGLIFSRRWSVTFGF
jgi:hypothetical protein